MDIRRSIRRLQEHLQRLLQSPTEELGRGGRFVAYQVRLGWFCGRKLVRDRLQVTASALSYKTLLSMVPVLILFTLILNAVIPEEAMRTRIRQALFHKLGLGEITYRSGAREEPADGEAPEPGERPAGTRARRSDFEDWLRVYVDRAVSQIQRGGAGITFVSILLFVWAGMSIFGTVEGAFNYIWEVRKGRGWFRRLRDFLTTITILVLLLGLAVWSSRLPHVGSIVSGASGVIPLLVSWLLFFVVYKTIPTVHVQNRAALTGAVVAGTLWELGAKLGFVKYVGYAAGAAQLYGLLALIPLFMLWVWISWVIVLFGAELAYVVQYMKDLTRDQIHGESRSRFLRADVVALGLAGLIARRFASGEAPPTRSELSEGLGVGEGDVEEVLDALRRAGLVRAVEGGTALPGYQPGRPLEQISAAGVVEAGRSMERVPAATGERGEMLRWARRVMMEAAGDADAKLANETLASLAARPAGPER